MSKILLREVYLAMIQICLCTHIMDKACTIQLLLRLAYVRMCRFLYTCLIHTCIFFLANGAQCFMRLFFFLIVLFEHN